MDLNDFENPIKYHYSGYSFGTYSSNEKTGSNQVFIKIERNEVQLQDSWWDFLSPPDVINFNNVQSTFEAISHKDADTLSYEVALLLSERKNQYGRKTINFLEVTGTVGGLFEIIDIFAGMFIGYIFSASLKKQIRQDLHKAEGRISDLERQIQLMKRKSATNEESDEFSEKDQENDEEEKEGGEALSRYSLFKSVPKYDEGHEGENLQPQKLKRKKTTYYNKEKMKSVFSPTEVLADADEFLKNLDCVDLVYSLKQIEIKLQYLLDKDPGYQENSSVGDISSDEKSEQLTRRAAGVGRGSKILPEAAPQDPPGRLSFFQYSSLISPNSPLKGPQNFESAKSRSKNYRV